MAVDVANIAGACWLRQLDISVGPIATRPLRRGERSPCPAVERLFQTKLGVDIRRIAEAARFVIGKVDLHRTHRLRPAQIDGQRRARRLARRQPEGARVFVGRLVRREAGNAGARRRGLAIGQQHPAGEQRIRIAEAARRHALRKVAEARRHAHLPVRVEHRRPHPDPPLERPIVADPRRTGIPPIAVEILERIAVPCPLHEPAGLVADGIVGGVGERPHRRRADIGARGIGIIFGAGRAILQIIASADLRHPSPLHEGLDRRTVRQRAAVILAEAFPAMMIGIEQDERYAGRAIGHLAVREVDRRAIDRKDVRRVPIEIPALVVVLKQIVPCVVIDGMMSRRVPSDVTAGATIPSAGQRLGVMKCHVRSDSRCRPDWRRSAASRPPGSRAAGSSVRLYEEVGGQPPDARIGGQRHVGGDDARMEQATLIENDAVPLRRDRADLVERGVAGIGIARQQSAIAAGGGDEGVAVAGIDPLDPGAALAIEGGAAARRIGQIVEHGEIARIDRIEMRRALRR
ncbi:hypothetical protein WR25_22929 [Diploscapter pachys]|uniref:Uncharacterized protein n=1 Tax=Diploscapter pachys TaxID=2018661 RepID=A0A2A2JYY2_9BILA|nr:hypothetical protein WR25_22929 [Diploscapter pachys]